MFTVCRQLHYEKSKMKVWNNRQHEAVLQEKKRRKRDAEQARILAERAKYDTRDDVYYSNPQPMNTAIVTTNR